MYLPDREYYSRHQSWHPYYSTLQYAVSREPSPLIWWPGPSIVLKADTLVLDGDMKRPLEITSQANLQNLRQSENLGLDLQQVPPGPANRLSRLFLYRSSR